MADKTIELGGPDAEGHYWAKMGDVVVGKYLMEGRVGDGMMFAPDDGAEMVAFPIMLEGRETACRYGGTLPRALALWTMHKTLARIIPLTPELKKLVDVFDRHDLFDREWANRELSLADVYGEFSVNEVRRLVDKHPSIERLSADSYSVHGVRMTFDELARGVIDRMVADKSKKEK